jgi:hypothetical protein
MNQNNGTGSRVLIVSEVAIATAGSVVLMNEFGLTFRTVDNISALVGFHLVNTLLARGNEPLAIFIFYFKKTNPKREY